jgi:hypothetical protein
MDGHETHAATELATILDADKQARISAAIEIDKLAKATSLLAKS